MTRMRIVQVANFVHGTSGGIRIALEEISARYVALGHEVMSIRPGPGYHLGRDELGRTIVELPGVLVPGSGGYRVLARRAPVAGVVASWRPDIVEIHDTTTLAWLGRHAHQLGAVAALFAHERLGLVLGDHLGAPSLMRRAATWHQHRALADVDVAFAPSRFGAAELAGAADVVVVPLGVDLDLFHPDRRHRVRRDRSCQRVLLVSRLTGDKRPLVAARAVQELRWRGWDVELLVAGDGPLRDELAAVQRSVAGGGITTLGHVADREALAALIADADAVVCPGPRETFGLAALEALATGTPIVCVDDGAIPELLVAGAGVTRPPTPDAFADGLAEVLAGDRDDQRAVARARAEAFTWDRTVDRLLAEHMARRTASTLRRTG